MNATIEHITESECDICDEYTVCCLFKSIRGDWCPICINCLKKMVKLCEENK